MSMNTGSRAGVSSEMNVTPLIDVLLVLLIIFMIVLPHHRLGETADIPLPNTDKKPVPPPEGTIVIRLIDAGENQRPQLKINEEEVSWDDLEKRLHEIYQLRVEKTAFLKGDPEIEFENIAEVLDITHRAGVDRVGLMDAAGKPQP